MDIQDFSSSKEGEGCGLSREGDGFRILGCKGHFDDRLPSERLHYQRRVQRQFIEAVVKRNQIKAGMLTKGVLFQQDNAPAHKCLVAMSAICDCVLVDYSLHSPDLAPSDYYFFPNMKKS